MKYFLMNGTFCENRPQGGNFREALAAHHAYWDQFVNDGTVLIAGPKMAGSGLLIVKCEDQAAAEALGAGDPFVKFGVQTYQVSEFKLFNGNECVKEWFKD